MRGTGVMKDNMLADLKAVKPAVQKRSAATRDKLITALESLLETQRFHTLTVQQLSKAAGVSVGTVYRRFDGRDALAHLLLELYDLRAREWTRGEGNQLRLTVKDDLRSALEKLVRLAWRQIHEMSALVRAVLDIARDRPELVGTALDAIMEQSASGVRTLIDYYASEVKRDPAVAAPMAFYFFQTILNDHALYPADLGRFGPPEEADFCAEIADFAYGYLTTAAKGS